MPERLYEYRVPTHVRIGASVYDDQNFDTVYFNEELGMIFASWCLGTLWKLNIKMVGGSDSRDGFD